MSKTIGIHQPNFLPWLGYFYKINACDQFVFLDHVDYSKGSFTSRVKIHHAAKMEDDRWLTVPLKKYKLGTPINELQIDRNQDVEQDILRLLEATYRHAPYYEATMEWLSNIFKELSDVRFLHDYNKKLVIEVNKVLKIDTEVVESSSLAYSGDDKKELVSIVKACKGTVYYSGKGGAKYQDPRDYHKSNIHLRYSDFDSQWDEISLPQHMKYKSIISYFMHVKPSDIARFLQSSL